MPYYVVFFFEFLFGNMNDFKSLLNKFKQKIPNEKIPRLLKHAFLAVLLVVHELCRIPLVIDFKNFMTSEPKSMMIFNEI